MKRQHILRYMASVALLAWVGLVSGCGALNPAGLVAASRLDPLNTPPAEIALAVGVPMNLRLRDGDAELKMVFRGGSAASTVLMEEAVLLQISPGGSAGKGETPKANASDEVVYVARISPADVPRISALQREIRRLKAEGMKGSGSLSIGVVGGCFVGKPPNRIAVSTWIQTDEADGFVSLTRRTDIKRGLGELEARLLEARLRSCSAVR